MAAIAVLSHPSPNGGKKNTRWILSEHDIERNPKCVVQQTRYLANQSDLSPSSWTTAKLNIASVTVTLLTPKVLGKSALLLRRGKICACLVTYTQSQISASSSAPSVFILKSRGSNSIRCMVTSTRKIQDPHLDIPRRKPEMSLQLFKVCGLITQTRSADRLPPSDADFWLRLSLLTCFPDLLCGPNRKSPLFIGSSNRGAIQERLRLSLANSEHVTMDANISESDGAVFSTQVSDEFEALYARADIEKAELEGKRRRKADQKQKSIQRKLALIDAGGADLPFPTIRRRGRSHKTPTEAEPGRRTRAVGAGGSSRLEQNEAERQLRLGRPCNIPELVRATDDSQRRPPKRPAVASMAASDGLDDVEAKVPEEPIARRGRSHRVYVCASNNLATNTAANNLVPPIFHRNCTQVHETKNGFGLVFVVAHLFGYIRLQTDIRAATMSGIMQKESLVALNRAHQMTSWRRSRPIMASPNPFWNSTQFRDFGDVRGGADRSLVEVQIKLYHLLGKGRA
ncbi:hypothetical protein B0H16DRAFT_1484081 [Mycena metata]|uniref:Uncharacterized protein n=1 Tax=Mycena metata TaxID=1033252 RepID=A0AAD7DV86_9AGAR|nr:hypothetical protein B0H16DRAFT_1484081 [Mycena metata]